VKITGAVLKSMRLLDTLALILSEIEADDLVPKPSSAVRYFSSTAGIVSAYGERDSEAKKTPPEPWLEWGLWERPIPRGTALVPAEVIIARV
jgi:hypothetical protein